MGFPIPNLASLPGASRPGGGGTPVPPGPTPLAQINNVYSMEFDGVDKNITTDSITIGNTFTFSLWVNANAFAANPVVLASPNYFTSGFNGNFILRFRNNQFLLASYNGNSIASQELIAASPSISDSQWYHVLLTNDGSTAVFYLDGLPLITTGVNTKLLGDLTNGLVIGDGDFRAGTSNTAWNGKIDEVGVWNSALTATDAQSIYNATEVVAGVNKTADLSQLTTPPVKWYRMGD